LEQNKTANVLVELPRHQNLSEENSESAFINLAMYWTVSHWPWCSSQ